MPAYTLRAITPGTPKVNAARDPVESLKMDEAFVRLVVRAKIEDGRLPRSRSGAVSATKGNNGKCDGCSTPVPPEDVLIRLSLGDAGRFVFHATCFAIWRDERDKMTSGRAILD